MGGENDGDAGIIYGRRRDSKVGISTTAHFLKPAGQRRGLCQTSNTAEDVRGRVLT